MVQILYVKLNKDAIGSITLTLKKFIARKKEC